MATFSITQVTINGNRFVPTDAGSIPTGELRRVAGTPFDFLTAHAIGERINQDEEQIKFGKWIRSHVGDQWPRRV
jgi:aldose 1-epimerase